MRQLNQEYDFLASKSSSNDSTEVTMQMISAPHNIKDKNYKAPFATSSEKSQEIQQVAIKILDLI